MTTPDPALRALIDRILQARSERTPLAIQGGNTKAFYGEAVQGEPLDVRPLAGISSYEPSELVLTARAGTPLAEVEAALAECGQCLPFEPPRFGEGGTLGGMVAAGLSGPARPSVGSIRDHVLGLSLVNGKGELLSFGGQVMKNVAGYDVSRLMVGALGVLGVICEVSLKVLPAAPAQQTVRFELAQADALKAVNTWAGQPLPLQASAWWDGMLVLRLAGAGAAVDAALTRLGGEVIEPALAASFWQGLRDHADEFFVGAARAVQAGATLWRLSVPATAPPLGLSGEMLIEWGGAQRWLCTSTPAPAVRAAAAAVGGHATMFRSLNKAPGVFSALPAPLERIHRELKRAFDPDGILNPGRFYPWL
ncbi:glycolate oxidase subunit GlcE [Ideonella sp. BN130291]|uniref:glycolate oxidase subunit GlcE n=1 Tax=Ideonella sp. BN130291 TaxID=3112940 RepID=UPI002E2655D3|nr:glycolate oxidase subunit GlcE [Ideonella sp. BN130291]